MNQTQLIHRFFFENICIHIFLNANDNCLTKIENNKFCIRFRVIDFLICFRVEHRKQKTDFQSKKFHHRVRSQHD